MIINLANKYRPSTWDDVCEQSIVTQMLRNICESENITNRNFLLIGPAGCGKTSLARVMAHTLNGDKVEPIEVDGASNNGVDSIRELIQQASQYPIGYRWKVIVVDECFPANAQISTPSGNRRISDISVGDVVYNFGGIAKVKHVFCNKVKPQNLIYIKIGDSSIITTKNHLFFTSSGWVCAKDLKIGDILYDNTDMQAVRNSLYCKGQELQESTLQSGVPQDLYEVGDDGETFEFISKNLSDMWKRILGSKEHRCKNLFSSLWGSLEETESKFGTIIGATCKTLALIYLSNMWEADGDSKQRSSEDLLSHMCGEVTQSDTCKENSSEFMSMVWQYIYSEIRRASSEDLLSKMQTRFNSQLQHREKRPESICSDDSKQPNVSSRNNRKDARDKEEKRHLTQSSCIAWWKWAYNYPSEDVAGGIRGYVDIRISGSNGGITESEPKSLSYELQVRPRISRFTSWDRGGWCDASHEIPYVVGRKENELSSKYRVESIEVYQRGYNERLFSSSFSDTELHSNYVTMYDLEIEGHPSYYVNDVLVHNCHALTNNSWQALLKTLEENPAKTIWIFCTTNPEKIPATVLSRVQVFQLSKISLKGITDRLKYVLDSEIFVGRDIKYDADAVVYIAKLAKGGMRDALTLTDKVLAFSENIDIDAVESALNLPNFDTYFALLSAYAKKDNESIVSIVERAYNSGINFLTWIERFHSFIVDVLKYIFTKDISLTLIPPQYELKLSKYESAHANICLQLAGVLLSIIREIRKTEFQTEIVYTYLCRR